MNMQFPQPVRPGDVIDVRAGPSGDSRRGVVIAACPSQDPPVYEVAWSDGTTTRLYASDRLVTIVAATEAISAVTDAGGC
jgi:hypothetical protein